ncbi:hypothetical protein L915_19343, partial [Phytophthora nicotianae]
KLHTLGVDAERSVEVFEQLYDLHFAPRVVYDGLKASIVAIWEDYPKKNAKYLMGQYLKKILDEWEFLQLADILDTLGLWDDK